MQAGDEPLQSRPESISGLSIASVTEVVYEHLRKRILTGMQPGQPLRLNTLAAELGVSTTPVRMALEKLGADGLVLQEGRRSATVAPLSLADFKDIYAVRRCLEGAAARAGTARMDTQDRSAMMAQHQILDEMASRADPDLDRYLEVEWRMHEICYEAAGHPRMLREIQSFRRQAERYFRLALTEGMNFLEDLEHQREFFHACYRGDAEAAEDVATALLDWTVERVAPILAHSGAMASSTV